MELAEEDALMEEEKQSATDQLEEGDSLLEEEDALVERATD